MQSGVTYVRLSEVTKGETGGIERQQRELDAFAKRLKVKVTLRLTDDDLSAAKKTVHRKDFQRLMQGIAANEWDVVILRSLDRWVRRPAELEEIIEVVEHSSVRVETIHGGAVNLRTIEGRMNARMVTTFSIAEVERTRQRVTDWHLDRASRGVALHGRPGFGFRKVDGRMVPDPVEAEKVRDAARRLIEGESLGSIGREWGKRGQWVRQTMLAPRIAGLRVHKGQIVGDADWEPIVDRVTWERVRAVLNRTRPPVSTKVHLLTGIAVCGKCGKGLNCHMHNGTQRYYCRHCNGVRIVAAGLERYIEGALFRLVDRKDLGAVIADRPPVDEEALTDRILNLEADLIALGDAHGKGHITLAEMLAARKGFELRLSEARATLTRTPPRPYAGEGARLATKWHTKSTEERRRIIQAWLPVLTIGPAVVGRTGFDATRVLELASDDSSGPAL